MNDLAGDDPDAAQTGPSIAADGSLLLCAFDDGQGFITPGPRLSYSWSRDNGATFTDGGAPPAAPGWAWSGGAVVSVNENSHTFFLAARCDSNLADPAHAWNGIAVVSATFLGLGAPMWSLATVVDRRANASALFDWPWIAADSSSNHLYLVNTRYDALGDRIEFRRSTDGGASWSAPLQLSDPLESGGVQGARVAVGPGPLAPVYVAYFSLGAIDADLYPVRRSLNGGVSFGTAVTAATPYHAFGSGAPGFNRGASIDFPSLAVDRSIGTPHSGRVYLAWHEGVNFYGDTLWTSPHTSAGDQNESEPNASAAQATPCAIGQTLRGTLSDGDEDWFTFTGTRGQTLVVTLDSLDASIDDALRLICSDGITRLAYSAPGAGVGSGGTIVFTLPADGRYYLRPASPAGSGGAGGYRIRTALHHAVAERARDHRDVFIAHSDDGVSWSAPTMVNDDPPYFDDWLPEVAVDANGVAYVEWYDWRDSPGTSCGGVSNAYLARSANGGAQFISFGAVSDAQSAWTAVASRTAPNQGNHVALCANVNGVYPAWTDGRAGSPDVYAVTLPLSYLLVPVELSLVEANVTGNGVSLAWYESGTRAQARLERSTADGAWSELATLQPDGVGFLRYEDRNVSAGTTYDYRLASGTGGQITYAGETSVTIPAGERFALDRVWPNPGTGAPHVEFALDSSAPAVLEWLDVSGRRVSQRSVGALGPGRHSVVFGQTAALAGGIYFVRLTQLGRVSVIRFALVR